MEIFFILFVFYFIFFLFFFLFFNRFLIYFLYFFIFFIFFYIFYIFDLFFWLSCSFYSSFVFDGACSSIWRFCLIFILLIFILFIFIFFFFFNVHFSIYILFSPPLLFFSFPLFFHNSKNNKTKRTNWKPTSI